MSYKLNGNIAKVHDGSIIYQYGIPYIVKKCNVFHTYTLSKVAGDSLEVVGTKLTIPVLVKEYFTSAQDRVTFCGEPLFQKESRKIVPGTKLTIHGETYTVIKDFVNRNLKLLNRHYMIMSDDQSKFIDEDKFYEYYQFTNPKIEWPT